MKKYSQGFTIIELIVVIAVIAVLATIVSVSVMQYMARARNSAKIAQVNSYIKAFVFSKSNNGYYPGYSPQGGSNNGTCLGYLPSESCYSSGPNIGDANLNTELSAYISGPPKIWQAKYSCGNIVGPYSGIWRCDTAASAYIYYTLENSASCPNGGSAGNCYVKLP